MFRVTGLLGAVAASEVGAALVLVLLPGAPHADKIGTAAVPAAMERSTARRETVSLRTDIGVSFA
ncbi:hypothetical protein GCM10009838_11990 [Catenulispora subtropica]|uniref:Uncharacterized protein n=1 Tax=Catenulispora subtropica TaxID=450798 RepID=A0ABN2QT17_9ACTN